MHTIPIINKRRLAFALVVLLAVGLWLTVPQKSRDERFYTSFRHTQSALERIEAAGGKCKIKDWASAFSHRAFMDPEIYYREKFDRLKQSLAESGYFVTLTERVRDLQAQTNQLRVMLKMRDVYEQTDAWYESSFHFDRDEVSVLCRRCDVHLWERALKHD